MRISSEEFAALVAKALDDLPEEFAARLSNVAVVVEEEPSPEDWDADDPDTEPLGLYIGTSQIERDTFYSALPDRIEIYRGPILRLCVDRREVVAEVRDTVLHELGHHFGLSEEELPF